MMKKAFTPAPIGISSGYNQLVRGFTLLELVVVIIILGVLATLGLTQYGSMVERARHAEVWTVFKNIRDLAAAYRLANGSITGITEANVNIGPDADQIPGVRSSGCRPSHYYAYEIVSSVVDPSLWVGALRCTAGGKPPQASLYYWLECYFNISTGGVTYRWVDSNYVGHDGWS